MFINEMFSFNSPLFFPLKSEFLVNLSLQKLLLIFIFIKFL